MNLTRSIDKRSDAEAVPGCGNYHNCKLGPLVFQDGDVEETAAAPYSGARDVTPLSYNIVKKDAEAKPYGGSGDAGPLAFDFKKRDAEAEPGCGNYHDCKLGPLAFEDGADVEAKA